MAATAWACTVGAAGVCDTMRAERNPSPARTARGCHSCVALMVRSVLVCFPSCKPPRDRPARPATAAVSAAPRAVISSDGEDPVMGKHDNTGDRHRPDKDIPPDKKDDDNSGGGGKRGK
ncbi:hypothetical protein GCM10022214_84070 [Actinomadura miaoliensis]|uniref:Uncharacterized protein n=1 Tax=Actinomadura miaoliensis TaxID=430685 RepID=A0ABP7X5S5_9ACTN